LTRIDFYELADISIEARARFACRLALKARDANLNVTLVTPDDTVAKDLDDLMWQYPRERFLPHSIGAESSAHARVHIAAGTLGERGGENTLLINLKDEWPEGWERFARIAEIIVAESRETSREKYRFYRTQVKDLRHHRLDDWEA